MMTSSGFCLECGTALEARHHEDRLRPTCPACGFIHYLDPKVAVAVILGDEHGVLLGRRCIDPGSGRWSFPAGYVNRGEVLEEAALREVEEELGVSVELRGLVGAYSERGNAVVLIVYAGQITAGDKMVTLAQSGDVKSPQLPNTPLLKDLAPNVPPLPGWYALVGPAKMDPKVVNRLAASVNKFLADPAAQAKLRTLFVEPIPGTPAGIQKRGEQEAQVWGGLIKELKIQAE